MEPIRDDAPLQLPTTLGGGGGGGDNLAGFDAEAFAALAADPEVKVALVAQTEQAVARGVFGAPTCFVGDEMFFGQDRLEFVREAAAS